jgi:hypothetical protein
VPHGVVGLQGVRDVRVALQGENIAYDTRCWREAGLFRF